MRDLARADCGRYSHFYVDSIKRPALPHSTCHKPIKEKRETTMNQLRLHLGEFSKDPKRHCSSASSSLRLLHATLSVFGSSAAKHHNDISLATRSQGRLLTLRLEWKPDETDDATTK